MANKLYDSERRVMEVLWQEGEVSARDIAAILGEKVGWSKTTTYTVITKCIDKGLARRRNPHFMVSALVSQEDVRLQETEELIEKDYGGAPDRLAAALLSTGKIKGDGLARLKELIEALEEK